MNWNNSINYNVFFGSRSLVYVLNLETSIGVSKSKWAYISFA
jgi:hypothetical protein